MSDVTQSSGRQASWLKAFARNVNSQFGEDGILGKVLEVVGERDGWCVEFGAWDGKLYSNTRTLIIDQEFSAVCIEANPEKYKNLLQTYQETSRVHAVGAFVGFEGPDTLDSILERDGAGIPRNFDLLSIDIDGCDYHVWEAVQRYQPKAVVIEFNPTVPNSVEFIQARDMKVSHGSGLRSLVQLAQRKGYELVSTTLVNAIFVDRVYYSRFHIADNSIDLLRTEQPVVTQIFCGYDGTVFLQGYGRLLWHNLPYRTQVIPKWLRHCPVDYGLPKTLLALMLGYFRLPDKRLETVIIDAGGQVQNVPRAVLQWILATLGFSEKRVKAILGQEPSTEDRA